MTRLAYARGKQGGRLLRWVRGGMVAVALSAGIGGAGTSPLYAQSDSGNEELDGRLEGYEGKVGIDKDSTTPLWFLYFFLVVVGCSALFKSAKRE